MNTVLTVILAASWVVIFIGLFLFERLEHRVAAIGVQLEQLMQSQRALERHLGVQVAEDPLVQTMRTLLAEGKAYEAIVTYRSARSASYKEAKAFVDALQRETPQVSH